MGALTQDFIIFSSVLPRDYQKISEEIEKRGRRIRLDLYDANQEFLWVTNLTKPHEALHGDLDEKIYNDVGRLGLGNEWRRLGASTYELLNAQGTLITKGEGDSARKPRSMRPSATDWPTIVIEAGYSQSLNSLRTKKDWWFNSSGHQVKIVILAKLYKGWRKILLEKWIEVIPQVHQAPTNVTTRAQSRAAAAVIQAPVPFLAQTIEVQMRAGITTAQRSNATSYTVTSGPLTLEFERLFLRRPGQTERDLVVDDRELRDFASYVWSLVE